MPPSALRSARVGDLLPAALVGAGRTRQLEATALLLPGTASVDGYLAQLTARADDFAGWDGRVRVLDPDGEAAHRLAVVDRYGQVYAVHDADDARALPDARALSEWFRFLATACPECGVLDDPVLTGPTL
ncbi:MAG TPA: hypothetical protein VHQ42_06675 [Candidatus Limnocylindria bacterium]|nr:hypothetical protein [Candidatus Limnocylindria bacterium]